MSEPNAQNSQTERVFLSYSRSDLDAAIAMRAALEQAGISTFRDEDSIQVSDNWMNRLQDTLQGCSAFVLLIGRDGVQRWVMAETQIALIRNFSPHDDSERLPIFPVLLPDGDLHSLPPFLNLFQIQRWSPQEPVPDALLAAIRAKAELLDQSITFEGCPFLGLSAFQPDDAPLFFGRKRETLEALAFIGSQRDDSHPERLHRHNQFHTWLQVQGNSGSGKSSLVNAGLLPLIQQGALWARTGYPHWKIIGPVMPGEKPLEALAEALQHALLPASERDMAGLLKLLRSDDDGLRLWLRDRKQDDTAFLLVVDQFEELFTFAEDAERLCFDRQLAAALQDKDCPLFLISTVRIDFLEHFERLPLLSELENSDVCKRYTLKTITQAGLRGVIEQPARLAGLDVSEVTTAMLNEAREEPGALPLVENALRVLWHERDGSRLSGQLYEQKGGIAGLLEEQADALLARLETELKARDDALELLFQLTRVNDEGRHTRRRLPLGEARRWAGGKKADEQRGQRVIDYLTGKVVAGAENQRAAGNLRLLNTVGENGDEQSVDLIHETLIRARGTDKTTGKLYGYWKTLYDYIEANRGRSFYRDQLERRAGEWRSGRGLFSRWRKLAGWGELRQYQKQRPERGSDAARFLRRSRTLAWVKGGALAVTGAFVLQSYLWTLNNDMPPSYMLTQQKFRLMEWGVLAPDLPEMVEIPVSANPFNVGELDTELGEDVNRQLRAQGMMAAINIGYPPTEATLTQPYALGRYEVTYQQYDYYVWTQRNTTDTPAFPAGPPNENVRGNRAVVHVSWHDAQGYLRWLSATTGDDYRLPTEVEWEWAARGGKDRDGKGVYTKSGYWWGDDVGVNNANCDGCGSEWDNKRVAPVGSFKPNGYGLYDTSGNVWEWTCSEWQVDFDGSEADCAAPDSSVGRVLRGGSWFGDTVFARASARTWYDPVYRNARNGFRVFRASRTR